MAEPKLLALLLCDEATRGENGKVTIRGVFDRLFSGSFPAVLPSMTLYFRLVVDQPETIHAILSFRTPSGVRNETPALPCDPAEGSPVVEGMVNLRGFELRTSGEYVFELSVGGKTLGSYTLYASEISGQIREVQKIPDDKTLN